MSITPQLPISSFRDLSDQFSVFSHLFLIHIHPISSLSSSSSSKCPSRHNFLFLYSVISLTCFQFSFIFSYSSHLKLVFLIFFKMSITPQLLISSFRDIPDLFSVFVHFFLFIPSQACLPHLLQNVHHATTSDFFIP